MGFYIIFMYSNNLVYTLKIDETYWYVGAHCIKHRGHIKPSEIIKTSGNPVSAAYKKKEISIEELKRRVNLVETFEFDTKAEAEDFEVAKVTEYKNLYGDQCINKCLGNKYGPLGIVRSEETRKKVSEAKGVFGILQYSKDGTFIAEYPSTKEAERQTGVYHGNICNCCKGKYKTAGGFVWQYKNGGVDKSIEIMQ